MYGWLDYSLIAMEWNGRKRKRSKGETAIHLYSSCISRPRQSVSLLSHLLDNPRVCEHLPGFSMACDDGSLYSQQGRAGQGR